MSASAAPVRILFFTPYSGRTGSEIMLYSLLRQLDTRRVEARLFSLRDGELTRAPENTFPVITHEAQTVRNRGVDYLRRKWIGISNLERNLLEVQRAFRPHLWYLNTIVMPEVATIAAKHGIPFAVHCHELQSQYNLVSAAELETQIHNSAFVVGCSRAVCESLAVLGRSDAELQYECVDLAAINPEPAKTAAFRARLGIPAHHKVVVMAGQQSEIKGLDIFVNVARELRDQDVHFLWLGEPRDSGFTLYYQRLAEALKGRVTLYHPAPADYYSCLDIADLFFLSSRSDPFPLVMIEAAYLGKYVVGLDSGGVAEFTATGAGAVLKTWNIPEIAVAIKRLLDVPVGSWEPAISIARAKEFDVSIQATQLHSLLERRVKRGPPGGLN